MSEIEELRNPLYALHFRYPIKARSNTLNCAQIRFDCRRSSGLFHLEDMALISCK